MGDPRAALETTAPASASPALFVRHHPEERRRGEGQDVPLVTEATTDSTARGDQEHHEREKTGVEQLERRRVSEPCALHSDAVESDTVDDVKFLLQHDNAELLQEKNSLSQSVLSIAAKSGDLELVQELLRSGADVHAKDDDERTALSYAVEQGHFQVVRKLIQAGADVDVKIYGRTATCYAAAMDYAAIVLELQQAGADVNARGDDGRTALFEAAERGCALAAHVLLAIGADVNARDGSGRTALRCAARWGDTKLAQLLLDFGADVNAKDNSGRTALWLATERGWPSVAQLLITHGASVNQKSVENGPETLLTLAGRGKHLDLFRALVVAGAAVNVRGGDGETPLISAARCNYFDGAQLLIAHGGCLRAAEVSEDESMFSLVLERLDDVCLQLCRCLDDAHDQEGTLVSFSRILFHFCCLLLQVEKRQNPLLRFIGSRAITSRVQDFHDELDHFAGMLSLVENNCHRWRSGWTANLSLLRVRFDDLLRDDRVLMQECGYDYLEFDAVILLRHELAACSGEEERQEIARVLDRFLCLRPVQAPFVPTWFISRDDVELHRWNLVRSEGGVDYYEGTWRKTKVMIESIPVVEKGIAKKIADWFVLSHPNVVKLFGACHIQTPRFFVYELVPGSKPLSAIFKEESNHRATVWKCLYEAALGLQYLHSCDFVHGHLRSESILVGSDMVTKICVKYQASRRLNYPQQDGGLSWMTPGLIRSESFATDIFALGACIWEAVTRVDPWQRQLSSGTRETLQDFQIGGRPAEMGDAEWDLISQMCASDPSQRVDIAFVMNQLKQFTLDNASVPEVAQQEPSASSSATEQVSLESVSEHKFPELDGDTIPSTLQTVRSRCEKLSDNRWMVNNVCPALEFIFDLLQARHNTPADAEVVKFCSVLAQFQRYLRTTVSPKSLNQLVRSRKVAEAHYVVYAELDRLLDMLEVPNEDPIRVWRGLDSYVFGDNHVATDLETPTTVSNLGVAKKTSGAVTLTHFSTPSSSKHEFWTQTGLTASQIVPSWYLPLRKLVFSESDEIGRGSFGTVYRGTWQDAPVVVKFMGYEEDLGTISTDLLLHEVRMWHRLAHPHVLKLYGACHVDKRYFVCEVASKGNLVEFLKKPGNEQFAWQKLHEAALGLLYLHGENVVHNDLWRDNIMVGMDGKAKLIDFGLSCLLNEAEIQVDVKQIGVVNYRSPECLAGERPSFASDVYSFAMCIIEIINGEVPWGRNMASAAQIRFQQRKGNVPQLTAPVTEKQRNLIRLMTVFDPVKRVRMALVVDKLKEIAQDETPIEAP